MCLADDVPEGHLDSGFGEEISGHGSGKLRGQTPNVVDRFGNEQGCKIAIDEMRRCDLVLAAPPCSARRFADTNNAFVCMNLYKQKGRHRMK